MYKKHHKVALLLLGFLGLLSSCDRTIHEYPRPLSSLVIIEPHLDLSLPLYYKEVVYNEKWQRTEYLLSPLPAMNYTPSKEYSTRLIVDIYNQSTGSIHQEKLIERRIVELEGNSISPKDTLHMYLNDGNYSILAWADYVLKGDLRGTYYDAHTLLNIHSIFQNFPADRNLKSAATGQQQFVLDLNLGPEGYPLLPNMGIQTSRTIPVRLSRSLGRYRIVASDYSSFIRDGGNLEGATVKVVYQQYVSVGYNALTEEPNEFISSYSFTTSVLQEPSEREGEITLLGDYLFTSLDKEDTVIADLYFYDANGKEINRCINIEIPLKRNRETVVKAPFLTQKLDNGGQVSIDENFEGEHIIEI